MTLEEFMATKEQRFYTLEDCLIFWQNELNEAPVYRLSTKKLADLGPAFYLALGNLEGRVDFVGEVPQAWEEVKRVVGEHLNPEDQSLAFAELDGSA